MRVPFNVEDYRKRPTGERMHQTERLLKYLKEQGPISRAFAFNLIGIAELSARVIEINRQKVRIGTDRTVRVNTTYAPNIDVKEYYLL